MTPLERQTVAGYVAKDAYTALGIVSYNGVRFPPYVHTELTYQSIESQDSRSTDGIKVSIKISGIILPDMFYQTGGDQLRPIDQQPGLDLLQVANPGLDLQTLRTRLAQRGKMLQIVNKGYGDITISGENTTSATEFNQISNGLIVGPYYLDIDNGPKPGELKLTPYGPRAMRMEWECSATFIACANKRDVNESADLPEILSMHYTTDIQVLDNLSTQRIIRGGVKVPSYLGKTDGRQDIAIRNYIYNYVFPKVDQFRRRSSWSLSEDRTLIGFVITDEEIASDNPYPRGFATVQADHTVKSSLDKGGFAIWNGNISVSGEVYPGYSKTIIWFLWAQIINGLILQSNKPIGTEGGTVEPTIFDVMEEAFNNALKEGAEVNPLAAAGTAAGEYILQSIGILPVEKKTRAYITSIEIKDEIFSRKGSVASDYLLEAPLTEILRATGILQPLPRTIVQDAPNPETEDGVAYAWRNWSTDLNASGSLGALYQMSVDLTPGLTPVDVCVATNFPIAQDTTKEDSPWGEPYPDFRVFEKEADQKDEKDTADDIGGYLSGSVSYRVEEDRQVSEYRYLEDSAGIRPSRTKMISKDAVKEAASLMTSAEELGAPDVNGVIGMVPGVSSGASASSLLKASARSITPTKRHLVIEGHFIRVGHKPVVPEVIGIGKSSGIGQPDGSPEVTYGRPLKVGKDVVIRKTLGKAIVLQNGETRSIYSVAFRKRYLLQHVPLDGTIVSNMGAQAVG